MTDPTDETMPETSRPETSRPGTSRHETAETAETARAEEPPRKMTSRERRRNRNGFIALLGGLMSLGFVAVLALGGALWFASGMLETPGPLNEETVVSIPEGSGAVAIASILQREGALPRGRAAGLIDQATVFRAAVRAKGAGAKLRAGEYLVPANVSVNGLVDLLTDGRAIQHKVTVPEGWTSWQVVQRLAAHEILEGPVPPVPAEGSLLPDTYVFPRGETRAGVLARMQEAQAAVVAEAWASRAPDLPIESVEELVTLASIVEKETGVGAERAHVASVFHNRLNRGMKIQSDPTIIYGIFGGEGKPSDRPIYRSDIDTPTPYNTYAIPALPPGPIANPGREALMAVARPLTTDDLYFVADGTGGHAFAETLDEHNRNVAQWRRIERELIAERERRAEEAGSETGLETDEDDAAELAPDAPVEASRAAMPLPPRRSL